jgi:hypothetical protein
LEVGFTLGAALAKWWHTFVNAVGAFLDEAAFRTVLAYYVVTGKVPLEQEQRFWNRAIETPVLIDVFDWTDDRRIFSVLVWPSLESSVDEALQDQAARAETVKSVISRGAQEMAWSMIMETDYGLRWNNKRKVWTASDGFAYDGTLTRDVA